MAAAEQAAGMEEAMKDKSQGPETPVVQDRAVDRRGFLKSIGGASVAGAAVATGAAAPALAAESDADQKKTRYRETDHVKAYYRTNRY